MTYEFVKHIVDNLRFGSYDGKWEVNHPCRITIKDVNSNTYVSIIVHHYISHCRLVEEKKFGKSKMVPDNTPKEYYEVTIDTGTLNPKEQVWGHTFKEIVKGVSDDYQFWDEFSTWVKAKWDDKVYKHKCLIEETFVL
jgi:hypothetical protein